MVGSMICFISHVCFMDATLASSEGSNSPASLVPFLEKKAMRRWPATAGNRIVSACYKNTENQFRFILASQPAILRSSIIIVVVAVVVVVLHYFVVF